MNNKEQPQGHIVIRTLAMPKDTNGNGDIFGGWLVSQMDIGGAILAMEIAQSRVATVAIDKITFKRPLQVGQTVCCYAEILKIGNTSMVIRVQAWSRDVYSENREKVTEGTFTFVSIDQQGRPQPVKRPS